MLFSPGRATVMVILGLGCSLFFIVTAIEPQIWEGVGLLCFGLYPATEEADSVVDDHTA